MATMASFLDCPACRSPQCQEEERRDAIRRECADCGYFFEHTWHPDAPDDRTGWRRTSDGKSWERSGRLRKQPTDQGQWVVMDTWFCVPTPLPAGAVVWDGIDEYAPDDTAGTVVTTESIEALLKEQFGSNRAVAKFR